MRIPTVRREDWIASGRVGDERGSCGEVDGSPDCVEQLAKKDVIGA